MKNKLFFIFICSICAWSTNTTDIENRSLTKYSQRGDDLIDIDSLKHFETSEYQIANKEEVRIILETKNNDIKTLEVIYDGGKKALYGIGNYAGKELFAVEIPNDNIKYYFRLKDGKEEIFFGKNITGKEKEIEKFNYYSNTNFTNIPEWASGVIGYQIYIDSFRNGNHDNDPIFNEFGTSEFKEPTGSLRSGTLKKDLVAGIWSDNPNADEFSVTDWTANYEEKSSWEENALNEVKKYTRYYGGDLQGITEKLDYLEELNIGYILLSSPFYSLSNHKYDYINLNHIDPFFGNIEQTGISIGLDIKAKTHNINGDKELNLLVYNPQKKSNFLGETENPETWVWTSSDLEMARLLIEAHKKNIKVVLEIAVDKVSDKFFVNYENNKKNWLLKQGTLDLKNTEVKKYILNSLKKWILGPDEEFKENIYDDGIDGIKFVYYDKENKVHLGEITSELKKYKKDLLILGEDDREIGNDIKLGVFDNGMDYNISNYLIQYMINTNSNYKIGNIEFSSKLNEIYNKYQDNRFNSVQIFLDSLDTDRIFSSIINPNRIFDRNNQSDQGYLNIRPDLLYQDSVQKLKKLISIQFMLPATPIIYYGTEIGMWGSDSPRNRKPMMWEDVTIFDDETDTYDKYLTTNLRNFSESVIINEVENLIFYKTAINKDLNEFYKKLLTIRKEKEFLFKNGKFRILETYNDFKTFNRVNLYIQNKISDEKKKKKVYENIEQNANFPIVDFFSYEVYDKNNSMVIVVNNSSEGYFLEILVPKKIGSYKNLIDKTISYTIIDNKVSFYINPNEVMILYSNDKFF